MKLVVPVKPTSFQEAQDLDLSKFEGADIIEWRADFLEPEDVMTVAPAIFEKFAGFEIIFSLRRNDLEGASYLDLLRQVQDTYQPDYLDFDYYTYQEVFQQMLDYPNLILSYYNLDRVPENIVEIFSELSALAPRVVRICCQPQTQQEVLDLMTYTRAFKNLNPQQIFMTIAMGELGQVTRIFGETFGSSWTSVKTDESSSPGQISLTETKHILDILERNK